MYNPFNPNLPADARFFANRKEYIERFERLILPSYDKGSAGVRNVAIIGPWGIGKTSLAHYLKVICERQKAPVVPVYISCTTGYGSLYNLAQRMVSSIVETVAAQGKWKKPILDELNAWHLEIRTPFFTASRQEKSQMQAASVADLLERHLGKLWNGFLREANISVMIVLDDAHALFDLDPNAMLVFRAVFQDLHLAGSRFGLVITGQETLIKTMREVAESTSRFFEHWSLKAFTRDDLRAVVSEPIQYTHAGFTVQDAAVDWLMEITEGHPYFVSFVLQDWYESATFHELKVIDREYAVRTWNELRDHLEREKFEFDWEHATVSERDSLTAMAQEPVWENKGAINTGRLNTLLKKNLIARLERGTYELYHPLFRDFVLRAKQ